MRAILERTTMSLSRRSLLKSIAGLAALITVPKNTVQTMVVKEPDIQPDLDEIRRAFPPHWNGASSATSTCACYIGVHEVMVRVRELIADWKSDGEL